MLNQTCLTTRRKGSPNLSAEEDNVSKHLNVTRGELICIHWLVHRTLLFPLHKKRSVTFFDTQSLKHFQSLETASASILNAVILFFDFVLWATNELTRVVRKFHHASCFLFVFKASIVWDITELHQSLKRIKKLFLYLNLYSAAWSIETEAADDWQVE